MIQTVWYDQAVIEGFLLEPLRYRFVACVVVETISKIDAQRPIREGKFHQHVRNLEETQIHRPNFFRAPLANGGV